MLINELTWKVGLNCVSDVNKWYSKTQQVYSAPRLSFFINKRSRFDLNQTGHLTLTIIHHLTFPQPLCDINYQVIFWLWKFTKLRLS